MNSRSKGKRGELELSAYLRKHGIEARRGQQFKGGEGSPDVVTDLPFVHIECKRVERLDLEAAMAQAKRDGGDKLPVVAHRKNRGEWLATLPLNKLLEIFISLGMTYG